MGFISFAGRVLFSSVFILAAWQSTGLSAPQPILKVIVYRIPARGSSIGKRFNEFGNDGGPFVKQLEPKYNLFMQHVISYLGVQAPEIEIKHLVAASVALKGIGGILFIFGSSFGAYLLIIYLLLATPILHDFYNYDIEKEEFIPIFFDFIQNLAMFGALLFFLGMKNSFPKKPKKKVVKTKTN